MNKPIKPNITIPESFAKNGVKTDFDSDLIASGFDDLKPDVLAGDNLNKFIDDTYQGLNYGMAAADAINLINEGETLTVVDGKLTSGASGGGLEIGDIGIAPLGIDETKGLRRYLNGQIVIQEQYVQFTNKLKSAIALYPSLACTESEWQATALLTVGGQVGKFVVDNDAGTIRLPKIIMPIQGLTDLSKLAEIVEAGLPNITGNVTINNGGGSNGQIGATSFSGSFADTTKGGSNKYTASDGGNTATTWAKLDFKASNSSATYGNSDTVQQEQIQYPYFIQVATGAETEDNIINEIELNNPYSFGDSKYSPVALNNLSWLKSEGQWNAKAVYPTAYDELLKEYNNPDRLATFNKDAFVVVGSPTITDDGVASGFSENDYVKTKSILLGSGNWKIRANHTTSNTVGSRGHIVGTSFGGIYYYNSSIFFAVRDEGSDFLINTPFEPNINTNYLLELEYKNNIYTSKYSVDNGSTWVTVADVTSSKLARGITTEQELSTGSASLSGSIDLKSFSITVDGQRVFSGANSMVKLWTDESATDYDFRINTAEETFRLPLLDGSEDLPSEKFVGLTLNASDSTYTAPANGWYNLSVIGYSDNCWCNLINVTCSLQQHGHWSLNNGGTQAHIPVSKGDIVEAEYGLANVNFFRFIYAQGNGSLYYYVGETVQNANLINAGRIEEKITNALAKPHIVESYRNGRSGYNIYSNGYCEQWGWVAKGSTLAAGVSWTVSPTLLKAYSSTDFVILATRQDNATSASAGGTEIGTAIVSANKIQLNLYNRNSSTMIASTLAMGWKTCGYIA